MSIVAVVRPGQTEFDEQERIQGTLDLPLTQYGETQITLIVDELRDLRIEQIYASPTDPAMSVARRVGEALGVPVKEVEGLENINHGLWQGLCLGEIKRKQPKVFKQWHESPESVCPPDGETCSDAFDRARKSLRKPLKTKGPLAIFSVEPMATVIESVVRGGQPQMPVPGDRANGHLVSLVQRSTTPETSASDE